MDGWLPQRSTAENDPLSIVQEARWALGPVWTGAENLAPTGIRSPDRPARSELKYRLSYPGQLRINVYIDNSVPEVGTGINFRKYAIDI